MSKKKVFLVLLLIYPLVNFSQDLKQEVEKRIKEVEMPQSALDILKPHLGEASRVKYYYETDLEHVSYECKFVLQGELYSVEFTEDGSLEDVEILIDFDAIDKVAAQSIIKSFSSYDRFRIRRTQRQFTTQTEPNQLLQKVIDKAEGLILKYEIVVSLKKGGEWNTYEMLFSDKGQLINQRKVIDRQTDNILY